ncbi:thioredoxin domain-containing protein [Streptomyces sp. ISL-96]|uniref:DsbA family protein n=1 Tax=Streptomyces sp. ISL-96 TaxID=2819191 RepID=UPI001BEBE21B|nr:thioredoxin domain-containing protein [Streptomyces sp. ISL-96]MBT2490025.1 thioredoxin domain-containing protein [Streptomyces sp. ISL-96]
MGDPKAPTTIRVYEDLAIGICREFETTEIGPDLRELMLARTVKTEYVFVSVLGESRWSDGSALKVINALRAALELDHFAEFHKLVAENYTKGGYTDASLLRLASCIPGLRNAAFEKAVETMAYEDFLAAAEHTYDEADPDVPTLAINGKVLPTLRQSSLYGKGRLSAYVNDLS